MRRRLSGHAYRRLTGLSLVALVFIVVTGAGVRLTGSGLGCTDWPTCEDNRLVAPWKFHAMVEFGNRTITGLVSLAVIAAVAGSLIRTPRRSDLTRWSLGLVAGVIGQIVLGGITVLVHLHPAAVAGHYLLSAVLVADAVVLHHHAGESPGPYRITVSPLVRRLSGSVVGLAGAVLIAGTVVTGSGPHGGDEEARRFGFAVVDVARVHSGLAWLLVATVVWLAALRPAPLTGPLGRLAAVIVAQGAVGYAQYWLGIPAALVALHVFGATLVWMAAISLWLSTRQPTGSEAPEPEPAAVEVMA